MQQESTVPAQFLERGILQIKSVTATNELSSSVLEVYGLLYSLQKLISVTLIYCNDPSSNRLESEKEISFPFSVLLATDVSLPKYAKLTQESEVSTFHDLNSLILNIFTQYLPQDFMGFMSYRCAEN